MITIEMLSVELRGVAVVEIERWVGERWLRPDGEPGGWRFHPVDVARAHLIRELRGELHVADDALPLVLSLLDQLYAERRRVRAFGDALAALPPDARATVLRRIEG